MKKVTTMQILQALYNQLEEKVQAKERKCRALDSPACAGMVCGLKMAMSDIKLKMDFLKEAK